MIINISQGAIINFGQNILNMHDNVVDSGDVIIVLIEAFVSMDDVAEPTNQVTDCMRSKLAKIVTKVIIHLAYIECHLQRGNTGRLFC